MIYVDPYLTDSVGRLYGHLMYGFKWLTPTLIEPEDVEADLIVTTHEHGDHFDVVFDAGPGRQAPYTRFAGALNCELPFQAGGITADRYAVFREGATVGLRRLPASPASTRITASWRPMRWVPSCSSGTSRVWQVGDTAYRPDKWQEMFRQGIDILIPPINGAFGNLDGVEASRTAADAGGWSRFPAISGCLRSTTATRRSSWRPAECSHPKCGHI